MSVGNKAKSKQFFLVPFVELTVKSRGKKKCQSHITKPRLKKIALLMIAVVCDWWSVQVYCFYFGIKFKFNVALKDRMKKDGVASSLDPMHSQI